MPKKIFIFLILIIGLGLLVFNFFKVGEVEAASYSYSSDDTYTVPAGVTEITVETWSAGGAGGGSTNAGFLSSRNGAGGGGGAYAKSTLSVAAGQTLQVVVGIGGAGVIGANGGDGDPSFVGPDTNPINALVLAAAGRGGTANTAGGQPPGGAGGSVANSIGDYKLAGGDGGHGNTCFTSVSGAGGDGANGGAGGVSATGAYITTDGFPGGVPGGGGGGSRTSQFDGLRTGGAGAAGRVMITEALPAIIYNLNISSEAGGSVTTPGEGTFTRDAGTVVDLVAQADGGGYQFSGWTGDVGTLANSNAAITTITMGGNYSITANFAIPPASCAEHNVWGWAWAGDNIGWISFSCTNTMPLGTGVDYGVDIDDGEGAPECNGIAGEMCGYAWAGGGVDHETLEIPTIGWIDFAPAEDLVSYPGCGYPDSPCDSTRVDLANPSLPIYGWARACAAFDDLNACSGTLDSSGGWDGWIKLGTSTNYGVWIDNSFPPPQPAEFRDWGWGGDDDSTSTAVIGWVSFNCTNEGVCGTSDYKVVTDFSFVPPNSPPYIEPGSQTVSESCCGVFAGQGQVDFQWIYRDDDLDPQTQFDFRVNNVNNVNDLSPEVDRSFSGFNNPDGTTNNQVVLVGSEINFGTTYYWWARVYDNQGNDSGWVAGPNFTTDSHAWPWVAFTWTPEEPSMGQAVQFTDSSECYNVAGNIVPCASWSWSFQDGAPLSSNDQNPTTTFATILPSPGNRIDLIVCDDTLPAQGGPYCCSGYDHIRVTFPLPEYREVRPVGQLDNFLARIANIFARL